MQLRHTGIIVSNIEKMIEFYKGLGFTVDEDYQESGSYIEKLFEMKGITIRIVKMGNLELLKPHIYGRVFYDHSRVFAPGLRHIAVTVKSCKDGLLSTDGKHRVKFVRDPEGNYVELVEEIDVA